MKGATRDQVKEVIARFATQVDWEEIERTSLQEDVINLRPEEFKKRFTEFLKRGARPGFIGGLKSVTTKSLSLLKPLDQGWSVWKGPFDGDGLSGEEDIDYRSLALVEVELTRFVFKSFPQKGKSLISREEKLRRLKEEHPGFIRFGGNVFQGLWEDHQVNGKNSCLEWLYWNLGITDMDFFGLVLRDPDCRRCTLNLCRFDDGQWRWGDRRLNGLYGAAARPVGCES